MSDAGGNAVLVTARYPEPGRVKTRLTQAIGDGPASELYRCFVEDTLEKRKSLAADTVLCITPEHMEPDFRRWLGSEIQFMPQTGNDLGRRMCNAFEEAFGAGYSRAICVGTDCPDLPVEFYADALKMLDASPAVLGPAMDGGYYLIGFEKGGFCREVFDDIRWGTDGVYSETVRRLRKIGRDFAELPPWRDVDTVDDLQELAGRDLRICPKTRRAIEKGGIRELI